MKKEDTKVINLGCRLNFFESEVIKNILIQENLEKKIVINTCAVTNQAVRKSINEVKKASRKFPSYQIYVTGCASQVNEKVFSDLKNVHKIVDNKRKTLPESSVQGSTGCGRPSAVGFFVQPPGEKARGLCTFAEALSFGRCAAG